MTLIEQIIAAVSCMLIFTVFLVFNTEDSNSNFNHNFSSEFNSNIGNPNIGNPKRDEIAAGQRWYVAADGSFKLEEDYYIEDITDETILFITEEDSYVRYRTQDVEFVERVPSRSYTTGARNQ